MTRPAACADVEPDTMVGVRVVVVGCRNQRPDSALIYCCAMATTSPWSAAIRFTARLPSSLRRSGFPRCRVLQRPSHDWGAVTFNVLAAEAGAAVPGVVMRETLVLYRDPPTWAASADMGGGGRRSARRERDELPPGYGHGLRFAVPWWRCRATCPTAHCTNRCWQQVPPSSPSRHRLGQRARPHPDVIVNAAGWVPAHLLTTTPSSQCEGRSFG
jgi:hypothetical protein